MESKRHIKPWFSEHELEELRKNGKDITILDSDGLPARHVSYDMSYLTTREEREKMFNEIVLGEIKDSNG